MEAFSDGVIAILITIMVLDLHAPEGSDLVALQSLLPTLLAYVLSFVFLAIYWNNHHHMLHAAHRVNGAVLWANIHLLFWLSLVPFMTRWVGGHPASSLPTAAYGVTLLFSAIAYTILQRSIIASDGADSMLARAVAGDWKGKLSLALYAAGVICAYARPWIADSLYVVVALIWLVPDRRIEQTLKKG